MRHSSIKAGLCALFAGAAALAGAASGAAQTPDETATRLHAEAAALLAHRAADGLSLDQRLTFEVRLDECATDPGACAALIADVMALEPGDMGDEVASAPVRLDRTRVELLPGSDGEIVGGDADVPAADAPASPSGTSTPQAVDTDRPVVESLTITPEVLDLDAGESTVWIDYEITDQGGSYLDFMLVELQLLDDLFAPDINGGQHTLSGNRSSGRIRIDVGPYVRGGEYKVFLWAFDKAENSNDLSLPTPTLTIVNSSSDALDPVLESLSVTPDPLTLDGSDGEIEVAYDVRDPGGSGLQYLSFGLYHVDTPTYDGAISHSYIGLSGQTERQGVTRLSVPAAIPSGQYYISVQTRDLAGNSLFLNQADLTEDRTLTIHNGEADTLPPQVNRLTVSPDAIEASHFGATLRVDYDVEDLGGSGLRSLSLSLAHDESSKRQFIMYAPLVEFKGVPRSRGSFTLSVPRNYPPGAYRVSLRLEDQVRNTADGGYSSRLGTTQLIWMNEPGKRAFGPFVDVVEPNGDGRDIFRITGLESGPPSRIEVAFRDPETYGFEGELSDCDLEIQPARQSGAEYLILPQDLAACGAFGSADVVFQLTPDPDDLGERIVMRRFRISETGMLSDQSMDRSPLSHRAEQPGEVEFGPFEWTETPASGRLHHFRLSGLEDSIPQSMDIAIANAAVDGFDGAFGDCTVEVPLSAITHGVYAFTSADLAACGDFGRADLSFRFTDIASYSHTVTLSRLVTTAQGAVTDFSFDQLTALPIQPEALSGGQARIEAGPFEWTGGPNAPTQNLFRISGITSLPDQIEVAIANAAVSGYDGAFSDCNLALRSNRSGANDYLISGADLADCGDFGRADLSFRITAPQAALAEGARVRRIAIGAHGDLTDFNFDHDMRPTGEIRESSNGQSNIVLGPFEWTGDHTVGTQNVFRITGITGAPTRIQAALADSTSGDFSGSFLDCELTIRPERASANDYVITSHDLADCGNFARADITFRVFANPENFQSEIRMRRFAITRTGGLTDFGFDNQ